MILIVIFVSVLQIFSIICRSFMSSSYTGALLIPRIRQLTSQEKMWRFDRRISAIVELHQFNCRNFDRRTGIAQFRNWAIRELPNFLTEGRPLFWTIPFHVFLFFAEHQQFLAIPTRFSRAIMEFSMKLHCFLTLLECE